MADKSLDFEPGPPYDVNECAKAGGFSTETVYRLVKSGELPHRRIGKKILILRSSLRHFFERSHPIKRGSNGKQHEPAETPQKRGSR